MDLVVIGQCAGAGDSTELQWARQKFLAELPPGVTVVHVDASDMADLERFAVAASQRMNLNAAAYVLLVRHAFLGLAPNTLPNLAAALDDGAGAAFAWDSTLPCPDLPPDYLTVRGMERYARRLGAMPDRAATADTGPANLVLMSVGVLRIGSWRAHGVWVAGAYTHDFSAYHQGRREDVIPLIPVSARRVLDVGGGEGGFLAALKSHTQCETHLAEFSQAACAIAAQRVDKVWPGDFMSAAMDVKFDCVTFLDVLEHTEWPEQWLERAAELLTPGGCVVASIPNVGHWSVVMDLLEGRWDYAPAGIHCVTHIRFFTLPGIERLMTMAGLHVDNIEAVRAPAPSWFDVSNMQGNIHIDRDSLSCVAYLVRASRAA